MKADTFTLYAVRKFLEGGEYAFSRKEFIEQVAEDTSILKVDEMAEHSLSLDECDIRWGEDEHVVMLDEFLERYTDEVIETFSNIIRSFEGSQLLDWFDPYWITSADACPYAQSMGEAGYGQPILLQEKSCSGYDGIRPYPDSPCRDCTWWDEDLAKDEVEHTVAKAEGASDQMDVHFDLRTHVAVPRTLGTNDFLARMKEVSKEAVYEAVSNLIREVAK